MNKNKSKFNKSLFFNNIFELIVMKKIPNIDLHTHTSWTDGKNTVKQMHQAAVLNKCSHILFSEHSRKSSKEWFDQFSKEVRSLDDTKCIALVGTEVKILDLYGNLDLNNKIKNKSDIIMASVHRFPGEEDGIFSLKNKNTYKFKNEAIKLEEGLMEAALFNKNVDILGHPFGMSIKRFKKFPKKSDFKNIIKKCSKMNKVFEINSHYHSEVKWLLKTCIKYNTKVSLGSNAHSVKEVGQIYKLIK